MLMADAFAITMIHIGVLIVLPGIWVLYSALFPKALARGEDRLRRMPYRTFFLGLGMGVVIFVATAALGSAGVQWLAGIIGGGGFLFALFGISPFARFVGSRLAPTGETPWKSHARGGVFLLFPSMLPFIGWFTFLPFMFVVGLGAGTLALFKRQAKTAPAPAPAPVQQEEKAEAIA